MGKYKCDVKFMGVPSRLSLIIRNLAQLGLSMDSVALDEKYSGRPIDTMMKAIRLPCEPGTTHRVIVQDDVELGRYFKENIDFLCNTYPDRVFSLFMAGPPTIKKLYLIEDKIICKTGGGAWGQAILMPLSLRPFIEATLKRVSKKWIHDDMFLQYCFNQMGLKPLTTIPCIVDHICNEEGESTLNHNFGVSKEYRYDPNADVREFTPKLNVSLGISMSQSIKRYLL